MTVAEIGSITRGKEVLRMSRWPDVIALTPPVKLFEMR